MASIPPAKPASQTPARTPQERSRATAPAQNPSNRPATRKKRRASEGTVRRRKDGTWEGRIRYLDPLTGLAKRLSVYAKTEGETLARLRAAASALDARKPPTDNRARVASFLDAWLAAKAPSLKPSTQRQYRAAVDGLVDTLGALRLCDLRPARVAQIVARLPATRTTALRLTILRAAMADAVEWGLIASNPVARIVAPRPKPAAFHTLTLEQVARFLARLPAGEIPLYRLALETGARQGELLALEIDDFDPRQGLLHIRRSLDKISRITVAPKTRTSRRILGLGPTMVHLLVAHIRDLRAGGYRGPLLFPSARGTHQHASNLLRRSFHPALERAGLPKMRFHDLRHTAATLWLQAGLHPKAVSERLGHSGIEITLRVYGHALPPSHTATATYFEGALGVLPGVESPDRAFPVKHEKPANRLD